MIGEVLRRWWEGNTFHLGAALAYYTVFAMAPVGIIAVAVAGLVFGEAAAHEQLHKQISDVAGPEIAGAVVAMVRQVQQDGSGSWTLAGSIALWLLAATTLFGELQYALNTIWGVKPRDDRGWLGVLKDRWWSFLVVLGFGVLLILSVLVSTLLPFLARVLKPSALPAGFLWWRVLHWVISLLLLTLLFALIYKVLPDVELSWRDVGVGAIFTGVLFNLGTYLIGVYLGWSGATSSYGAAGSFVAVLLWVYYSSQLLLFGAVFTQVHANRYGRPLVGGSERGPSIQDQLVTGPAPR
jgi:membrane protein